MGKLKCVATLSSVSSSSLPVSDDNHGSDSESSVLDMIEKQLTSHVPQVSIVSYTTSPVWSCVWSTDGLRLASCHGAPDSCVRIWMRSNRSTRMVHTRFTTNDNEDKDEEPYVLIATLQNTTTTPTSSHNHTKTNVQKRTIRSAAFAPMISPHVRYILAIASFDGTISIWEDFSSMDDDDAMMTPIQEPYHTKSPYTHGWECTAQLEGHENEVKDVTWNTTGTLLASCGRDKSVWIWECFLPGSIGGDVSIQKQKMRMSIDAYIPHLQNKKKNPYGG